MNDTEWETLSREWAAKNVQPVKESTVDLWLGPVLFACALFVAAALTLIIRG